MNPSGQDRIQRDEAQISAPKISIIVPVYNVAGYVLACLESLQAQTMADFEAIVIDDGSSDGSDLLARDICAADPRFQFVAAAHSGLSGARNIGLDRAQGTFVCFVDSDDWVAENYLERLLHTLEESDADWVACAIRFCHATGHNQDHPAIHGVADLTGMIGPTTHRFTDWRDVVRHFPSAWNKIYRRDKIGDLRFDEGLDYEDHAFFYRYAQGCSQMVHLPEPLYLSTQGRVGQITRDGSDKVFEQFEVLDILQRIFGGLDSGPNLGPQKTGGAVAFLTLATRLTFERLVVITSRPRRAAFLARARIVIKAAQTAAMPDFANETESLGVPAFWPCLLDGRVPVSVVIPSDGNGAALRQTLDALERQTLQELEIILVADRDAGADPEVLQALTEDYDGVQVLAAKGVAGARNCGLAAASGDTVVFLDAGDQLPPVALAGWHNRLVHAGAQVGFSGFIPAGQVFHSGLHDPAAFEGDTYEATTGFVADASDAVIVHAHPSAKIFERAFLNKHQLRFAPEPLSSWFFLLATMTRASRCLYLKRPAAMIERSPQTRQLWRAVVPADQLRDAVAHMAAHAAPQPLSDELRARLFVRAIWEKLNFAQFPDAEARTKFMTEATAAYHQLCPAGLQYPDPYIGARLRRILDIAPV
ncbi:MAG: glycosyltransferase involved in cell wall biosynthesis [Paracoccaceae bacterium]|jgi:glycosyltransferase involved in cell wall biosynthesis